LSPTSVSRSHSPSDDSSPYTSSSFGSDSSSSFGQSSQYMFCLVPYPAAPAIAAPAVPPGTFFPVERQSQEAEQEKLDTMSNMSTEVSQCEMCEPAMPPTKGSIGHPFTCNQPCKYFAKKRGCKDESACDHCHLCAWKPIRHKKKLSKPRVMSKAVPALPA
jgi:hypothetical protein